MKKNCLYVAMGFVLMALGSCGAPKIGVGNRLVDAGNAAAQFPMHGYEAHYRAMEMSLATQIARLSNYQIGVLRPEFLRDIYTELEINPPVLLVSVVFPQEEHTALGGIVLVTNAGDVKSACLAKALAKHLRARTTLPITTNNQGNRPLLKAAGKQAITLEIGNFTNPAQAAWLGSEIERAALAQAIADFMLRN